MNKLQFAVLAISILIMIACSQEEPAEETAAMVCTGNYAEYIYNGNLFATTHLPHQGEILTPAGESCGIGAAHDSNIDLITMRIFDDEHQLILYFNTNVIMEDILPTNIQYTDPSGLVYDNLDITFNNYIRITELDHSLNTLTADFNFQLENDTGETITLTDGIINCSFNEF